MAQNGSRYRSIRCQFSSVCNWKGVSYNVFECKTLLRNEPNTKYITKHVRIPGKVECSNTSDWSIFYRKPKRDRMVILANLYRDVAILLSQKMRLLIINSRSQHLHQIKNVARYANVASECHPASCSPLVLQKAVEVFE